MATVATKKVVYKNGKFKGEPVTINAEDFNPKEHVEVPPDKQVIIENNASADEIVSAMEAKFGDILNSMRKDIEGLQGDVKALSDDVKKLSKK